MALWDSGWIGSSGSAQGTPKTWSVAVQGMGEAQLRTWTELFQRDLELLGGELLATPEEHLWETTGAIRNSIGTLTLHLCGNLQHFVGAVLGGSGYVRDRDAEFATRGSSRDELLHGVEEARMMVVRVLSSLPPERLLEPMQQVPPRFEGSSIGFYLAHLSGHLAYHLGQVNYLRRALSSPESPVGRD